MVLVGWMIIQRSVSSRRAAPTPAPPPQPSVPPAAPRPPALQWDEAIPVFLGKALDLVLERLSPRWLIAYGLGASGLALIISGWHPVEFESVEIQMDRLYVVLGIGLCWGAAALIAPEIRPSAMPLRPPTAFTERTMWILGVLGLLIMLVMIYWVNRALGVLGYPIHNAPDSFTPDDFALMRWSGILLILIGGLPWVWWLVRGYLLPKTAPRVWGRKSNPTSAPRVWEGKNNPTPAPPRKRGGDQGEGSAFRWLAFIERHSLRLWGLAAVGAALLVMRLFWMQPYRDVPFFGEYKAIGANDRQLIAYFSVMGLFILGMMRPADFGRIARRLRASWTNYKKEWLLVLVLTLMALGLRLYRLDSLLPVRISDEGPVLQVTRLLDSEVHNIGSDRLFGERYLMIHINSVLWRITGYSLFNERLLPALMGTLAIPFIYLTTRRILNWQAATLASLLLMAQPLHFHFSRIMLSLAIDPTLGIAAVWLIWDGIERGGKWKFALAGVLVGIAQSMYVGSRVWILLIIGWWLVMVLRQPRALWVTFRPMLVFAAGVLLAMLPMIIEADYTGVSINARQVDMSQARGGGISGILHRPLKEYLYEDLNPAIRAYYDAGDVTQHFEYVGHVAINFQLAFIALALGLAYGLRFTYHPGLFFMLLWFGATTVLGGSLTNETPGYSRYLNAMLPMSIIAGIGVWWFIRAWAQPIASAYRRWMIAPMLIVAVGIMAQNLDYMTGLHAVRYLEDTDITRWRGVALSQESLRIARNNDGNDQIYWLNYADPVVYDMRFLEPYIGYHGKDDIIHLWDPLNEAWLAALDTSKDSYIFVAPYGDDPADITQPLSPQSPVYRIMAAFPGARLYRYDSSVFPTTKRFSLYSLVVVPSGTPYCSPECRSRQEK